MSGGESRCVFLMTELVYVSGFVAWTFAGSSPAQKP